MSTSSFSHSRSSRGGDDGWQGQAAGAAQLRSLLAEVEEHRALISSLVLSSVPEWEATVAIMGAELRALDYESLADANFSKRGRRAIVTAIKWHDHVAFVPEKAGISTQDNFRRVLHIVDVSWPPQVMQATTE